MYENGLLKGKKAMLSFTTGGSPENFGMGTRKGPLLERLYSIYHEKLYYCGIEVLEPYVAWGPQQLSMEERERVLDLYEKKLIHLSEIHPYNYIMGNLIHSNVSFQIK